MPVIFFCPCHNLLGNWVLVVLTAVVRFIGGNLAIIKLAIASFAVGRFFVGFVKRGFFDAQKPFLIF